MATITKPMALDESFNTTESTSRNQADVLVGIEQAIMRGFGQVANAVSYDNTDSGLTADNVQDAIDEVDDTVDGLVDDVTEISSDIESTQTASGNPLTLTNVAPINAESLKVELLPKQDLHGYQYPWVGGAGKNKADKCNDVPSDTGITVDVSEDGTLTINGTANTYVYIRGNFLCDDDSATYSWALFNNTSLSAGIEFSVRTANNELAGGWEVVTDINETSTFVPLSGKHPTKWQIQISQNTTINNAIFHPMIVKGDIAPNSFAPYSNICPITGYTEVGVEDVGKNLFDKTDVVNGGFNADGTVHESAADSRRVGRYIAVEPSIEYYISNAVPLTAGRTGFWYDENKTSISQITFPSTVQTSGAVTSPNNAKYIRLCVPSSTLDTAQLEVGNQATVYEPFQSTSATIQFGQTVYSGTVDFKTGKLTVDKKIKELTGNDGITWTAYGSAILYEESALLPDCKVGGNQNIYGLCSCTKSTNGIVDTSMLRRPSVNGRGLEFGATTTSWGLAENTSTALNTMLATLYAAGTPLQICYEIAEPFEIQLTPAELRLLKGTNNLSADGVMQIGYQPDNVIGEAIKVSEEYTDRAVGKNILPMTLAGIKAANPHLTWTDETSFTSGNVTVTFQVAGGDIYGIHIVSTGSNGEFFNLCFDGVDYSRFDGYILSGCDVNDENKIYIAIRKYGGANYFAKNISGDTVINYTAGQKASIFVYLSSGSVDTVLKPMIRKPNMDNTYETPKPSKEILMDLIAYLFTQI